jgi:hypothetical protein
MFYFYLSSATIISLVVMSRKWPIGWRISASAAVWAITLSLYYLLRPNILLLGPSDESSWWVDTLLFLILLLGMGAKYLWDLIEVRNKKNAKLPPGKTKAALNFDAWDLVKPMLVSVLVFYAAAGIKHELTRTAVVGSFQNGFFWQTIFKKAS